jgi:ubiquinone/menaquinone biosynthesis C-methylase UbiE
VLATVICQSSAFQQKSTVNAAREAYEAGNKTREPNQRATDLLKAMEVLPGDWVADVGAGAGYYSMRLSQMVGPEGKVFAEDISTEEIGWLNERVKIFDLRNVEVVRGEIDNPKLPSERLAAILIVDSYHHFTQYQSMLEQLRRALKPGGRLVIVDYSLPAHRTQSRTDQLKIHELDPELVRTEVAQAGFQVVKCEDPFLKDVKTGGIGLVELWLMVAVRQK